MSGLCWPLCLLAPRVGAFGRGHTDRCIKLGQFNTEAQGRSPYWPQTILERCIRPAATAAGIGKKVGWHTFRYTYPTLLKDNGEDVKVVQELLRHANARITLDLYAQAITESKRLAQARVMTKLVPQELVQ